MSGDALGYYAVLEVAENADIELVKSKYRDLAKFWHPDRNASSEAMAKFQMISEAWNVLSDNDKRNVYDLLSAVYQKHNYPDVENMVLFGDDNEDVRALVISKVRAWIWGYKAEQEFVVCGYKQALLKQMKNAFLNWVCGWWHPKAFVANLKLIKKNWQEPISIIESRRILVHNLLCYKHEGNVFQCNLSALKALRYADCDLREKLFKFINDDFNKRYQNKDWNITKLRLVQIIAPILLLVVLLMPVSSKYVSETELLKWFSDNNEIKYYQEVKFVSGERGVDDVVVGKVLSIPVDKRDVSRLYHLQRADKVMYGPGDDFDVLKELDAQTTVRLTGVTPDNVWSRIMIDNGEMGFVRTENIISGIGKEIPYGSQIF